MKKSQRLLTNILDQMEGLNKCRKNFMISLFLLLLRLRGRHNFLNLSRYGSYCEKSYRLHYEKSFDFLSFNLRLLEGCSSGTHLLVFDQSFVAKSGSQTPHLDKYWCGSQSRALRGLELGCLAMVDLQAHTAFHLSATQTWDASGIGEHDKNWTRVDFYADCIIEASRSLQRQVKYLCVDGFFAKHKFLDNICSSTELEVICKLRKDADLRYLRPTQAGKKKRGRPALYDGKVNLHSLNLQRFHLSFESEEVRLYECVVNAKKLKRNISLCYVMEMKAGKPTGKYQLLFSTDTTLAALSIYRFYKARFLIEFLFRDAKQYTGLTQCEARSENKINFHWNAALSTINVAKAAHYLTKPPENRGAFSMCDIQNLHFNEMMLDLILSNLEIKSKKKKIKKLKRKIRKLGKIAA